MNDANIFHFSSWVKNFYLNKDFSPFKPGLIFVSVSKVSENCGFHDC